jgi:hypothetical protein
MNIAAFASFFRRYSLDRHRPVLMVFEIMLFVIGVLFWVQAGLQAEAFNHETFGRFALMFPAELWAGAMMAGSAIAYIGLVKPIRRNMVAVGAAINAIQYSGLAYSSIFTGGEFVIGIHLIMLFVPAHIWMTWEALRGDGV